MIVKENFVFNIPNEYKKSSGIYKITQNIDNRIYVGSAKNLWKRFIGHFNKLETDEHKNPYLQAFYNKNKEKAVYTFHLLELVDLSILIKREQFWLDETRCYERDNGFNICPVASSTLGTKRTEEQLRKISGVNSPFFGRIISEEHRKLLARVHKGNKYWTHRKPYSEETIRKMSEASKGNQRWKFRKPYSQETLKKMSEANRVAIIQIDYKTGNFIKEYSSSKEAAHNLDLNPSNITKVCKGKRKQYKGYKFIYKSEYLAQNPYIPQISLPPL